MRCVSWLLKFAIAFLAVDCALAQVNPATQIRWPQPGCSQPQSPYNPATNACVPITTTGGMPTNNPAYTGVITGPMANQSTMDALLVTAPPYGAKCDGSTDDQAAIQQAFSDAQTENKAVRFPAGICLTSTINWNGQPFFGAGKAVTTVRGKPGQHVFQGVGNVYGTYVQGLTIQVDGSVNAAATAGGGNNTFPTQVAGTAGGLTPLASAPVSVGQVVIGGASMTAGSNALNVPNGYFTSRSSEFIIGAPITVPGAGTGGAVLTTTIAGIVDGNNVTLAANAVTTVSNATVSWGNPAQVSPPWYIGNCGIALPWADASGPGGFNLNAAIFRDLQFEQYNAANGANHTCGFFTQSETYDTHFDRVDFMGLFMGYAEALPYANANTLFAWTGDTSSYKDINFKLDQVAGTFINGTHRSINGFNIYSGVGPFALGFFWFNGAPTQSGYPSGTISHYYDECWSNNTGEHSRFSGIVNISGGNLSACGGPYIRWDASNSTIDAQINLLQVYGGNNTFRHTGICATCWVDNGANNRIDGATDVFGGPSGVISQYANRPHEPLNKLNAGFLLTGTLNAPFTSSDDLLITCDQFNFAFQNYGTGPGCTSDPTGTEITRRYVHMLVSAYNGSFAMGPSASGQGTGPYGKYLSVGDRLPQAKMIFLMLARCDHPCTQLVNLYDDTGGVQLYSQTLSFGTSWTVQTIAVDFSAIALGHNISMFAPGPLGGTGVTYQDLALIAFSPQLLGPQTVSFTPLAAAGSGATVGCKSGWICSQHSGVLALTTGTVSGAGDIAEINWILATQQEACTVQAWDETAAAAAPSIVQDSTGANSTPTQVMLYGSATSAHTYTIRYVCI